MLEKCTVISLSQYAMSCTLFLMIADCRTDYRHWIILKQFFPSFPPSTIFLEHLNDMRNRSMNRTSLLTHRFLTIQTSVCFINVCNAIPISSCNFCDSQNPLLRKGQLSMSITLELRTALLSKSGFPHLSLFYCSEVSMYNCQNEYSYNFILCILHTIIW